MVSLRLCSGLTSTPRLLTLACAFFPSRPIVFEHLSMLLSSASVYSILLIERAVVGLLRLCLVLSTEVSRAPPEPDRPCHLSDQLSFLLPVQPSLRDQLYVALDLLRSLPSPILNSVSEQLMAGVAKILEQDASLIKSVFFSHRRKRSAPICTDSPLVSFQVANRVGPRPRPRPRVDLASRGVQGGSRARREGRRRRVGSRCDGRQLWRPRCDPAGLCRLWRRQCRWKAAEGKEAD